MAVRETTVMKTHTHKPVFNASAQEPHENRNSPVWTSHREDTKTQLLRKMGEVQR